MNDEHPNSIEAERALLAGLMMEPERIDDVKSIIQSSDAFWRISHQHIYNAIADLYDKDGGFDWPAIIDHITAAGKIHECGGPEPLRDMMATMVEGVPSGYGAERHAQIVTACYVKRVGMAQGRELTEMSVLKQVSSGDVIDKAWSAYQTVNRAKGMRDKSVTVDDAVSEAIEMAKAGGLEGLHSSFGNIHKAMDGLVWDGLYVVGARPGIGKTAFSLQMMQQLAIDADKPVECGIWSCEMLAPQMASRMICLRAEVSQKRFKNNWLNNDEWSRVEEAKKDFAHYGRLRIDDMADRHVGELITLFKHWKKKYGTRVFFVDYIQNMAYPPGVTEERIAIKQTSIQLKRFAMSTNSIVIAAAQLNRESEKRKGRPVQSDLDGCSQLEKDADGILLIHRLDGQNYDETRYKYEINIVKNRHGSPGRARFWFEKGLTKFIETETHENQPFGE